MKLDTLKLCPNLQTSDALNKVGANSSTSQLREGTTLLSSSRRTFLQSTVKSAAALSLESVLALGRSLGARFQFPLSGFAAAFASSTEEVASAKPDAGLGLS